MTEIAAMLAEPADEPSLQELWDTFPGTSPQFLQLVRENEPELADRIKWCSDCHEIIDRDTCPYAPHEVKAD